MLKGWKKVYKFSFIQTIKTKSFIVSTILTLIIINGLIAGLMIIPPLMASGDSPNQVVVGEGETPDYTNELTPVKTAYVIDNTGLDTPMEFDRLSKEYAIDFIPVTGSFAEEEAKIKDSQEAVVLVSMDKVSNELYSVVVTRPFDEVIIWEEHGIDLADWISSELKEHILTMAGVNGENMNLAKSMINYDTVLAGDTTNIIERVINIILPIITSIALFILIFSYGQVVAQSIATEKTSRVMELLLTSARPLAVIVGKVLAMGTVALGQFLLMAITTVATTIGSAFINANISATGGMMEIGGELVDTEIPANVMTEIQEGLSSAFGGFSFLSVILILIVFILGFLFYALIAGLVGASVSRIEDLAQAMQPYALIGVFGFYLSYFPVMFDAGSNKANFVTIFSRYIPLSSPFALPSAILTGQISTGESLLAVAVLAISVALFAMLVAKVYETLILHNGNRIKFGQILKIARSK